MNALKNTIILTLIALLELLAITDKTMAFEAPQIELRGFGTVGLIKSNTDLTLLDYGVEGRTINLSNLSLVGLNVHAEITPEWDVATQFEARGDSENYNLFLNWGFASWHPNSEFAIRAGRLSTQFWLYSQQIDVGLSYMWTTLPTEVYTLTSGFKSVNGFSFLFSKSMGPGVLKSELILGEGITTSDSANPFSNIQTKTKIGIKYAVSADLQYELDHHFTARASYAQAEANGIAETAVAGSTIGTSGFGTSVLSLGRTQLFSGGVKYDSDSFFVSSEIVRRLINGTFATQATAYYLMAGYNFGKWTPLYTYSESTALVGTGFLHPDPTITSPMQNYRTNTLGLNYHVNESIILKSSFGITHQDYTNAINNLNFNTYALTLAFAF